MNRPAAVNEPRDFIRALVNARPAEQDGGGWHGHCLTTALTLAALVLTPVAALIWSVTT